MDKDSTQQRSDIEASAEPEQNSSRTQEEVVQQVTRAMRLSEELGFSVRSGSDVSSAIAERLTSEHIGSMIRDTDSAARRDHRESIITKAGAGLLIAAGIAVFVWFTHRFLSTHTDQYMDIIKTVGTALISGGGGYGIGRSVRRR